MNYSGKVDLDDIWFFGRPDFQGVLPVGQIGPERPNASTNWVDQACQDWSSMNIDGVNLKHFDCDGNGIVDFPDNDYVLH